MKRFRALLAGPWRTAILLGVILALCLALLPASVLAYHNPLAAWGWGRSWQPAKHSGPVTLDLDDDEVDDDADDEDEEVDDDADDDQDDEADQDEDEVTEPISGTVTISQCVTLRGPVSAVPAEGAEGEWVIAGQAVQVTASTHLSARARRVAVGDWATARAVRQEDGTLVALSVTVMHANRMVRVVGVISEVGDGSLVIAGVTVVISDGTRIVGTPAVGRLADAHGSLDEGGAFVARLIVVRGTSKPLSRPLPPGKTKRLTATPTPGETSESSESSESGVPGGHGRSGGEKGKPGKGKGR